MAGLDMSISGLASGFDWKSVVEQLTAVERTPQTNVRTEQTTLASRRSALGQIATQLTDLQTKATALGDSSLYNRRSVSSSDTTIASVSTADGAVTGSYSIEVIALATPSSWLGATSGVISSLHTADINANAGSPAGPVLSAAGWGSTLTAGTVTIGVQNSSGTVTNATVTVATTDTLKEVLVKLDTAIGSTGGATYSSANDQVTITRPNGTNLILGSASDTSNLLSCLKLFTPASGANAVSDSKLGSLKLSGSLSSQPLVTPLTYKTPTPPSAPAETTGAFSINGVSISYSSSSTLASVLNSINDSAAGVQASFDSGLNRIVLKNKEAGNRGVVLAQSDGGNFLTAFGLTGTGSSLSSGTDLTYKVNGEVTPKKARSNTIKDSDSGLTGLTITASKVGTTTINSANDTGAARSAVDALVSSVNRVQSLISSLTVSNRDAAGKITAGVLAYDQTIFQLGSSLRSLLSLQLSGGPSTTIRGLADLGYSTTGYTNELSATNSASLNTALSSQLSEVQKFFSTTTTGLSERITSFVKPMVDENSGTLPQRQKGLTEQSSKLDDQLVAMERRVQSNRERLLTGFRAMEAAQAKSNSQMQFLNQKLGIA
ncbi:MAG: flagellar filament capping protein FliD [Verrucomicrobia bacterium]|nr:flagellar filament capping protein FliD [Verrucomicrobiota bacterium]